MKDYIEPRDQGIVTGPTQDLGETAFSSIVAAGGGSYVGVLKEIPDKIESLVLFNSPQTRTTLAIPISCLTAVAVREHLADSDAAFTGADAKWQAQMGQASFSNTDSVILFAFTSAYRNCLAQRCPDWSKGW
jgi:hypothetical protein